MGVKGATSRGCYYDKARKVWRAKVDILGRIVSHNVRSKEEGLAWCRRQILNWEAKYC